MFLSHNWVDVFVTICTIGWKFAQLGGKLHNWVEICTIGWKFAQLGGNLHNWVENYTIGCFPKNVQFKNRPFFGQ